MHRAHNTIAHVHVEHVYCMSLIHWHVNGREQPVDPLRQGLSVLAATSRERERAGQRYSDAAYPEDGHG